MPTVPLTLLETPGAIGASLPSLSAVPTGEEPSCPSWIRPGPRRSSVRGSRKFDDIKQIIEHQNERIRLLEEKLELLRNELHNRRE